MNGNHHGKKILQTGGCTVTLSANTTIKFFRNIFNHISQFEKKKLLNLQLSELRFFLKLFIGDDNLNKISPSRKLYSLEIVCNFLVLCTCHLLDQFFFTKKMLIKSKISAVKKLVLWSKGVFFGGKRGRSR